MLWISEIQITPVSAKAMAHDTAGAAHLLRDTTKANVNDGRKLIVGRVEVLGMLREDVLCKVLGTTPRTL